MPTPDAQREFRTVAVAGLRAGGAALMARPAEQGLRVDAPLFVMREVFAT